MKDNDGIKITGVEAEDESSEAMEETAEITVDELIGKLAELQKRADDEKKRADDMTDAARRVQAEFDNYRRRTIENNARMRTDAQGEVLTKLLAVTDVIGQAMTMITDENVKKGVSMIEAEIVKLLASYDVTEIDALGQEFDPRLHEAIMQAPAESDEQRDTVREVFQKGYKMGDKVIRAARVIVNK